MNETPTTDPTQTPPDAPTGNPNSRNDLGVEKRLSDRILAYAFGASVLINIGWMVWVSNSDIFGKGSVIPAPHETQFKVFKRPPPPKPKLKKPPPPPPPPKQQPHVKPPPIHLTPHLTPHAPTPHMQRVHLSTSSNSQSPIALPPSPPATSSPPATPAYVGPVTTPPAPPTPLAPVTPPAPPPPAPVAPPTPPTPPPVPPPPPPKPKPPPDRDEPEQVAGSFTDINLPQFDASTLSVTDITATWEVDERGKPKNIKLDPRTSGNADVDSAIYDAISKYRYLPERHNGVAEEGQVSHTFHLTN